MSTDALKVRFSKRESKRSAAIERQLTGDSKAPYGEDRLTRELVPMDAHSERRIGEKLRELDAGLKSLRRAAAVWRMLAIIVAVAAVVACVVYMATRTEVEARILRLENLVFQMSREHRPDPATNSR